MSRFSEVRTVQKIAVFGLLVAMIAGVLATPSLASAQQSTYSARIITGTCAAPGAKGLIDLPTLGITDAASGYAYTGVDFGRPWAEFSKLVFAEPSIVIVYKGSSYKDAVKANWVLCGDIKQSNSNRNGLGVALAEVNNSAMAGMFNMTPENDIYKTAQGNVIALENAIVHWTPEPASWELQHRFIGSRGTCESPSTDWWQFTPLIHIGPVAGSSTIGEDTQVHNFNGGVHYFSIFDTSSGGTMIACGNALGETRTTAYPEGFFAFRMNEANNSGYVGFVVVYNVGEHVMIRSYLFPGARR